MVYTVPPSSTRPLDSKMSSSAIVKSVWLGVGWSAVARAGGKVVTAQSSATTTALRQAVIQELRELRAHTPGAGQLVEVLLGRGRRRRTRPYRTQQRVARRVLAVHELDDVDAVPDEAEHRCAYRVGQRVREAFSKDPAA